jgi:hypothetical protein
VGLGEKVAVEAPHVDIERIGEAASVHLHPQLLDLGDEGLQPGAAAAEELEEAGRGSWGFPKLGVSQHILTRAPLYHRW